MWFKQNKWKLMAVLLAVVALAVSFKMGDTISPEETIPPAVMIEPTPTLVPTVPETPKAPPTAPEVPPVEEPTLPPVEPETAPEVEFEIEPEEVADAVSLTVSCATILNNWDKLDDAKQDLVPEDGIIYSKTDIPLVEGESVFDLLLRVMQEEKIHLEYASSPLYQSAYIEGIGNLYEFDCGPLSGWVYKVNDWSPNYGGSLYSLKNEDKVEILYTCDLGKDVGGTMVGGE